MTTTDTTVITERWTYLGRRYWVNQGIVHLWEKADGTEGAFKKLPATAPGGIYEVTVVGGTQVRGAPRWTGDTIDVERRMVLQAADRAAWDEKAAVDAEKRLAKGPDLDRVLEPLEALARACRTTAELEALQSVVRARIAKARWAS